MGWPRETAGRRLRALVIAIALSCALWAVLRRPSVDPCRDRQDAHSDCADPLDLKQGSIRGNRDGTPGQRVP